MSFALRRGETAFHLRRLAAALLAVAALFFVLAAPRPALSQTGNEFPSLPAVDSYEDWWLYDILSPGSKPPIWVEKQWNGPNTLEFLLTLDTTRYQTGMWEGWEDWYFEVSDIRATIMTQNVVKLVGSDYNPVTSTILVPFFTEYTTNPTTSQITPIPYAHYPITANGKFDMKFVMQNRYWDLTHGGDVIFHVEGNRFQYENYWDTETMQWGTRKKNVTFWQKTFAVGYELGAAPTGWPGGYSYTYDMHWKSMWFMVAQWQIFGAQIMPLGYYGMPGTGGGPINPPSIPEN